MIQMFLAVIFKVHVWLAIIIKLLKLLNLVIYEHIKLSLAKRKVTNGFLFAMMP